MRVSRSFASRLSLGIVVSTSAIFLTASLLLAFFSAGKVKQRAMFTAAQVMHSAASETEANFMSVTTVANNISWFVDENIRDVDHLNEIMSRTIEANPFIVAAGAFFLPYAYDKNREEYCLYSYTDLSTGKVISEKNAMEGYHYLDKDWFVSCIESGQGSWTTPFIEKEVESLGYIVSYSVPIRNKDGNCVGVYSVDMPMAWFCNMLNKVKPFEFSEAVIIDEDNHFICNPASPTPYDGTINDAGEIPGCSGSLDFHLTPGKLSDGMVVKSGDCDYKALVQYSTLSNGWHLVILSPYNDVFAGVRLNMIHFFSVLFFGVLVILLIVRRQVHKHTDPVTEYAYTAYRMAKGNFNTYIAPARTKDEIKRLHDALTYLQSSILAYIEELKVTAGENERYASELNIASSIQTSMLNTDFPENEHMSLYASSTPAKEVGGDLYAFDIKDGKLYFLIADVSGKGVPAALVMSLVKALFDSSLKLSLTLDQMVEFINDMGCKDNRSLMFVTLFAGSLDLESGKLEYCNAGHNPIVVCAPGQAPEFLKADTNIVCGVMSGFDYSLQSTMLPVGSRIIVYTDGVTEAENTAKELYGEDRLLQWAGGDFSGVHEKDVVESLLQDVKAHTKDAIQNDDITIMSIRYKA